MRKVDAHMYFDKMGGRAGISERILEIAQEIIDDAGYKRATAGAGQLHFLAEVCDKTGDYWSEITARGYDKEMFYAENPKVRTKPLLNSEGHYSEKHHEISEENRLKNTERTI